MAKLTLAEMSAKLDEDAHNGNLSNLAHGLRSLVEAERAAEVAKTKFDTEVARLRTELETLAQGEVGFCDYDAMKDAYSKAQSISLVYTPGKKW